MLGRQTMGCIQTLPSYPFLKIERERERERERDGGERSLSPRPQVANFSFACMNACTPRIHTRTWAVTCIHERGFVGHGGSLFYVGSKNKPHMNWPHCDNKRECHCCLIWMIFIAKVGYLCMSGLCACVMMVMSVREYFISCTCIIILSNIVFHYFVRKQTFVSLENLLTNTRFSPKQLKMSKLTLYLCDHAVLCILTSPTY